jgi:para-aminobenzoate synthetase/4-amino-4-deoxychorismate lyase
MNTDSSIFREGHTLKWLSFQSLKETVETHDLSEVMDKLRLTCDLVEKNGWFAAGFVSYEAAPAFDPALATRKKGAFPLIRFDLYSNVDYMDDLSSDIKSVAVLPWKPSISQEEYYSAINTIRNYILNGDTYQVNFTLRLNAGFDGDPQALFSRMIDKQNPPYGAFLDIGDWIICSSSPELFFSLDGETIESRPMKGTAPRGLTCDQDLKQAEWLHDSPKNRAENVMIVDMVRNDLGRIAEIGSIEVTKLYHVEKYPTLWQMTSTVRSRTRAEIPEIFQALFPPASITGAPKPRTMQIIREMEQSPRQIYTGAIGYILPGRRAQFNVAIRTVLIDGKARQAQYGVGGGIVWDSTPEGEWMECQTKALALLSPEPEFSLLESILWTPEQGYALLDYHLKRLSGSANYFDFRFNLEKIRESLDQEAEHLDEKPHKVRLLLSRKGEIKIESGVITPPPKDAVKRVCIAKTPIDTSNDFLYHKTTHRDVYEKARAECPGFDDVILWNERGEATESTVANIVVEIDGALYTPPVSCGLLPGTWRAFMLDRGELKERVITLEELKCSSQIHLINSIRGMERVILSSMKAERKN